MLLLGSAAASTFSYLTLQQLAASSDCAVAGTVTSVEEQPMDVGMVYRVHLRLDDGYECVGIEESYVLVNGSLSEHIGGLSGKRIAAFLRRSTKAEFYTFVGNTWYFASGSGVAQTHKGDPITRRICAEGAHVAKPAGQDPRDEAGWLHPRVAPWLPRVFVASPDPLGMSFDDFLAAFNSCRTSP
jgi:hypothetical protein